MTYPSPLGIKRWFKVRWGVHWYPCTNDPVQYGSGFLIRGQQALPIMGVGYQQIFGSWLNVEGEKLLWFDHPVPYTA